MYLQIFGLSIRSHAYYQILALFLLCLCPKNSHTYGPFLLHLLSSDKSSVLFSPSCLSHGWILTFPSTSLRWILPPCFPWDPGEFSTLCLVASYSSPGESSHFLLFLDAGCSVSGGVALLARVMPMRTLRACACRSPASLFQLKKKGLVLQLWLVRKFSV